jgi:hypothetical protein
MYMTYNQSNDLEAAADRYICLQRSRSLYALDPLSGATLWVRQDIPQGSVTFGDGEYVFVLPPDKPEALVLRALDGEPAGTRKIPRREIDVGNPGGQIVKSYAPLGDSCPFTLGRNLLFWRLEQNHRILELFDPWTQKPVWPRREFSFHAQYSILGNELIGVLEPDGKFVMLNLADGRTVAEINLKPEPYLAEITLFASEDRYLLLTNTSPVALPPGPLQQSGIPSKLISKGRLYAIDGSGKLIWPEPVAIENQQLFTSQPRDLPILLFVRQKNKQKENSSGRALSILAIDKRSGRTVYNSDLSKPIGSFNIVGNAEKKNVNLMMQYQTVTLTFTDNPPRPPDKQVQAANAKQPRVNTSQALLKSLEKTMGQMFGLPAEDSLDEEEP